MLGPRRRGIGCPVDGLDSWFHVIDPVGCVLPPEAGVATASGAANASNRNKVKNLLILKSPKNKKQKTLFALFPAGPSPSGSPRRGGVVLLNVKKCCCFGFDDSLRTLRVLKNLRHQASVARCRASVARCRASVARFCHGNRVR